MKNKKVLALCLTGIMALSALVGCGGGSSSSTEDTSKDTATEDTAEAGGDEATEEAKDISGDIHYAFWDVNQQPYLEACIEEFYKEYPDVNIILEPTVWADYWTKLEAAATGGSLADVFWMNGPNIAKYAQGGILMPVEDMISEYGLDTANYPEGLINLYNIDGTQYALPKDFDTIGLWYNKAMFDAAGLDYPTDDWTWDDLKAAAEALTTDDVYGFAAGFDTQSGVYNTIFAAGGYVINDDKTASGYDLEATQEGIQCWIDLMEAGVSPSQASLEETTSNTQLLNGQVAMAFQGSWFLAQVVDADIKDDLDCVELPSLNGNKATVIHGLGNCIFAGTENPEAAKAWVAFLAGETANTISAEMGAAIPALAGTAQAWVDAHPEYNLQSYITSSEEYSYAYPASVNTGEWNQYESDNLKNVFALQTDVKTACDNLAAQMNDVLANE